MDIRNDNGAIDTATFGGTDFFNPGTPVSNWGIQKSTDTSTFRINNTSGGTGQPVSVSLLAQVSGTYTGGGANVGFVRSYSLVSGQNSLRVSTTFTNDGATLSLRYFDTFDPDQGQGLGQGFTTFNDVFLLGGSTVGQARINAGGFQHTVIAGSADSRVVVAAGSPFQISNGGELNSFLAGPFDGNDAPADQGLHIGLQMNINAGGTDSFSYDLAFGLTPLDARNAFLSVPEPTTATILVVVAAAVAISGRRRRLIA